MLRGSTIVILAIALTMALATTARAGRVDWSEYIDKNARSRPAASAPKQQPKQRAKAKAKPRATKKFAAKAKPKARPKKAAKPKPRRR